MRRILSFLLTFPLLFTLAACGAQREEGPVVEEKNSVAEVNQALGYDLLELQDQSLTSAAVIDGTIGQAEYQDGKSAITLRMTLDSQLAQGLAGYENAGKAGGIEAPADVFSQLEIYVIGESLYYCEFSFTSNGYTCYLSLAETKTDFASYSDLLIAYANQLYNMEEVPSFVYAIDPTFVAAPEEPAATTTPEPPVSEDSSAPSEAGDGDSASASILLEYYDITLNHVGDAYTFSPEGGDGAYTWESADKEVAIVSPEGGTVTAVGPGTTTVTCTSGDGLSVEVIVRVKAQ